ncbi:RYamide receptor-like [Thrips palmi]|uniref:RYamide receptor-like n=1 Tax=Thrips palmi TaxID=161013 RepID=A0A6P9A426_THRPL|nr:RYamide receptor-like [Thrips palmi]
MAMTMTMTMEGAVLEAGDVDAVLGTPSAASLVFNLTANVTEINCEQGMPDVFSGAGRVVVYLMYITVFCVALVGNGLVVYVVAGSPRMRSTTNYWLLNLAVGDMLMTLVCVPFSFVSTFLLQYWPFGAWMCPVVNYSQAVSVMVSAYTLVAISADRYVAILRPLRPRLSTGQLCCVLAVVWAGAALTALPVLLRSELDQPSPEYRTCDRAVCAERWDEPRFKYFYSMLLMALQYLVPLLVLMFTYTRIALVVWGKRTPGEAHNIRDQRMAVAKRKMIKMMVTVVLVFTICWLPLNTLLVTWDNDQTVGTWSLIPYVYLACHWLAMSHCCANPLIYCWMNSRFRQGFRQALARLCCGRCGALGMGMGPMGLHGAPGCGGTLSMARGNTMTSYVSVRRHKSQAAIPLVRTALSNGHQQQQQQQQQDNGNGKLISNGYRDQQF